MGCCAGMEWDLNTKPDGVCPKCGEPTVDGEAYDQCEYSPTECKTCGDAPCDGSC